ncbi:acid protease [Trematosphaeria pertusa]|uniref:Acid protease n=1 Tax=Trematosphaeria pertusa TaxID=390896 RepID=A0A6A6IK05_9PLEO|nr:acid protease [Trematosphaeria pertusa]KAF2249843.1 acid protease [Trematosphaeria pertusa]
MIRHRGDRTLFALLVLLALPALLGPCVASVLEARGQNGSLPAPLSVAPNQNWEGIDGKWNTVSLRVGTPYQWVRVFVSTASQQTWTIDQTACLANRSDPTSALDSTCMESRGRLFSTANSTTWDENGFFQLWTEKNLGLTGNGLFGWDTVGLGLPGEEGPTMLNTTVGTLISPNFWLGHFGVNPKPTNFSAFTDASPSYMTMLFDQKQIPSVSVGYTAGAQYHDAVVLSSLTLGGYDSSRFIPNDITFEFAPDNERDIVVGIVGITANSSTKPATSLLKRDSFTMYIDSTVAELWLPIEVCEAFEDAFGLSYDNDTGLYLLDDQTHQRLLAENPSITFSLGQKFTTNATVDITLPYAALDLEASPPYRGLENATKYFPIRRGEKESQFVLGRTFLQEAYLLVDWERQNFSVYECSWVYGQEENIVPIISPVYTGENKASKPHHLTTGTIIGIALGAGFGFAITVCGIIWFFWRRRHKRKLAKVKADYEAKAAAAAKEPPAEKREDPPTSPTQDAEEGTKVFPKAELPADSVGRPEMSCDRKEADPNSLSTLVEVDNTERQVFEMLGDIPSTVEAGGRQLSEKESMMVRERIYNGVDPYGTPDVSPTAEDAPRRQAPVSPSEVAMVNRRLPDVSPTTPRARDGASLEANDTFFQPPAPRAPRDGRYLEAEDTLLSPISPLEGSADTSRRRFSYES